MSSDCEDIMHYCDECRVDRQPREETVRRTFIVHGKEVMASFKIFVCPVCETELYDEDLANDSMRAINEAYAAKYGMTAEEIRSIRVLYKGLGIRPYAKILGMGPATISRHEAGFSPSEEHLAIYRELQADPRRILAYFSRNNEKLSSRELKKTREVLTHWRAEHTGVVSTPVEAMQDDEEIIESIHKPYEFSELTGYTSFNLEKLINMTLYFSRNGINITRLMKHLWYTDMFNYRHQTVSVSGAVYTRKQFGPVPMDHDIMMAHLEHMGVIEIEETIENEEGWTKKTVKSKVIFEPSLFTNHELALMEKVERAFAGLGSRAISAFSHKERAWIETPPGEPINYNFAMDLQDLPIA